MWAKCDRGIGGRYRGVFHSWRPDGLTVCAPGRKGTIAKFRREKQPVNACRECLRILGGDKRLIQRYPLAGG